MDIMNNEFKIPKDLRQMAISAFRQDPKLTVAIDKLQAHSNIPDSNEKRNSGLVLPDRKLNFQEVRQLLSRTDETIKDKSPDVLLKEHNDTRKSLLKKVEDILDNINRAAENKETPKLIIRNQRLWSNCIYDFDRVTLKAFNDAKKTVINYSNSEDRTRFNIIVFVLTKVHELLSKNLTVTRRELFYQNVTRLRSQSYLDVAVRDACCLLETPPWSLGITATAKGLVAGPLTMETAGGKRVDCMGAGGVLVPQDISGIKSFATTAKYILVVEKDAIFQKLLDEGALARLGPVIILTGKGYPDVCSRRLLRRLSRELRLRALALVDPDPHGMEIFLTYKYGSLAQSHLSSSLACPSLALLGARHSDVMTLAPAEARMRLTDLDRRKLNSLLKRPYLDNAAGAAIKKELKSMLSSGVKAELEALAPTTAALCDAYLTSKLIQGHYLG
ncbi:meiotic recombination protein SPO11 [Plutella xylostella]|uniref:meiotic recombination protein SPO11 n=1 Tax=Plutella xylostella TaxID=51655 RepID=UPI00203229E5|nr:meiotic recombination protein SPO11 [Plutella xylostella]